MVWFGEWELGTRKNQESFFWVPLDISLEELSAENLEEKERKDIKDMKWWSLSEMQDSKEIFIPQDMVFLLSQLFQSGPSSPPLEIDLSTPKQKESLPLEIMKHF